MPKPRRFAMVTTFYPPYSFGGDATFLRRLVHALADDDNQVDVVHCVDSYRLLSPNRPAPVPSGHPNVRIHRLESRFGPLSPLLTQQTGLPWLKSGTLRRVLEDGAPDVIHFHNVSLVGGPGVLTMGNAPKLYTTHEHWLVCPMHVLWKNGREVCDQPSCLRCQIQGRRPPQLWRYGSLLSRSLDAIDRFIAPSRFTMRMHQERGLAGRPFVHLPYFVPTPPPIAKRVPADRPFVLFVGRLETIKGVDELIDVFADYDRADLVIAGDGTEEAALRRRAAGNPRVRFAGRLSSDALTTLYRDAVALIVPSRCYEVFGIVILEAFATGTPAIVRDLGALPEVIADSDGGLTFRTRAELVASIDRLIDDSALRERLGRQGYQALLDRYTTQPHLATYYDLIHGIEGRQRDTVRAGRE